MFHRAGHRVVMAEFIGWHLSRYSRAVSAHHRLPWPTRDLDAFTDALIDVIRREGVDLYIPTCEELFWVALVRDRLTPWCEVFVDDIDVLERAHDKWRFLQQARQCGLDVPPTLRADDTDTLRALLADALAARRKVVLKPTWSRFAAWTVIAPSSLDTIAHVVVTPDNPWLVQDHVQGRHLCTWGIAHAGRLVAHGAYPSLYTLGVGATVAFESVDHPGAERWAETYARGSGFTGQLAFDLIESADGRVFGIECNPRLTSGVHLFADQPGLLDAFWTPDLPRLHPTGARPSMLGVSMLIFLLQRVRTPADLAAWRRTFGRSREVVHALADPVPALWRYVGLAGIVARARRMGLTEQQAVGVDMEYNGRPDRRAP